jgi:His-Xaa-Ser system protein HxsD
VVEQQEAQGRRMSDRSEPVVVTLDAEGYSIDAAQRAAHRLSNALSAEIEQHDGVIVCRLFPLGEEDGTNLAHDFRREVLDQELRERIRQQTEPVRNAVLALAFSNLDVDGSPDT